jgi:hypothetical protein
MTGISSPGTACPGRWAAPGPGPTRSARSTTTTSAPSTTALCWPATCSYCRPGRRRAGCPPTMRSRAPAPRVWEAEAMSPTPRRSCCSQLLTVPGRGARAITRRTLCPQHPPWQVDERGRVPGGLPILPQCRRARVRWAPPPIRPRGLPEMLKRRLPRCPWWVNGLALMPGCGGC